MIGLSFYSFKTKKQDGYTFKFCPESSFNLLTLLFLCVTRTMNSFLIGERLNSMIGPLLLFSLIGWLLPPLIG